MQNPFFCDGPIAEGHPLSGSTLVTRAGVTSAILERLHAGGYIQVVGPSQSGRTTLALDLLGKLRPPCLGNSYIPVLLSCGRLPDARVKGFTRFVIRRFREVIANGAKHFADKAYDQVRSILRNANPETMSELNEVLADCGSQMPGGEVFVLIFDEFQAMPRELTIEVLRSLRGLYGSYTKHWLSPYRVVILNTHDVSHWKLDEGSPFNVSSIVSLPPFSRQEFDMMLDDQHAGSKLVGVSFSTEARETIYKESGGRPYFLQRLCHAIVSNALHLGSPIVFGKQDVTRGVLEVFEEGDKNLKVLRREIRADSVMKNLCRSLVHNLKVPFQSDYPIDTLSELGVIADADHFCSLPVRLYERDIVNTCFAEDFSQVGEILTEEELLLVRSFWIQKAILSTHAQQMIRSRLVSLKTERNPTYQDILHCATKATGELLKRNVISLDFSEVRTYAEYYRLKEIPDKAIIHLLGKAFVASILPQHREKEAEWGPQPRPQNNP
jgi:hypothetical protein